jgi:hypothetical protein
MDRAGCFYKARKRTRDLFSEEDLYRRKVVALVSFRIGLAMAAVAKKRLVVSERITT